MKKFILLIVAIVLIIIGCFVLIPEDVENEKDIYVPSVVAEDVSPNIIEALNENNEIVTDKIYIVDYKDYKSLSEGAINQFENAKEILMQSDLSVYDDSSVKKDADVESLFYIGAEDPNVFPVVVYLSLPNQANFAELVSYYDNVIVSINTVVGVDSVSAVIYYPGVYAITSFVDGN